MAKAKPTDTNPERELLLATAKMVALLARNGNPRNTRDQLDQAIAEVEGEKDAPSGS
jgi:hypothetical protein